MPSRAYTSFLLKKNVFGAGEKLMCQCPFGLIHHFYVLICSPFITVDLCVNALSGLYLISTARSGSPEGVSMTLCQCPLGLIPHFYVPLQKPRFYAVSRACFCRYLSEYSDSSRFSCMLTFWTYLMRCTYP